MVEVVDSGVTSTSLLLGDLAAMAHVDDLYIQLFKNTGFAMNSWQFTIKYGVLFTSRYHSMSSVMSADIEDCFGALAVAGQVAV